MKEVTVTFMDDEDIYEKQRFLASRNIVCSANEIALKSLQLYAENHLDFVDNVLFAYNQLCGITIYSYDRKLMNAINRSNANPSK